jgi:hypothetical protein
VEPKHVNAAFIPFRIVDFAAPDAPALAAAVAEVMDRLVQDEKYAEGEPGNSKNSFGVRRGN